MSKLIISALALAMGFSVPINHSYVQNVAIYSSSTETITDEDGEIFHHLCHFLRFQFPVDFASRVFLDSLTIARIDAAVAAPSRVAVADKGEEAYGDVVKGWFQCTPH